MSLLSPTSTRAARASTEKLDRLIANMELIESLFLIEAGDNLHRATNPHSGVLGSALELCVSLESPVVIDDTCWPGVRVCSIRYLLFLTDDHLILDHRSLYDIILEHCYHYSCYTNFQCLSTVLSKCLARL